MIDTTVNGDKNVNMTTNAVDTNNPMQPLTISHEVVACPTAKDYEKAC